MTIKRIAREGTYIKCAVIIPFKELDAAGLNYDSPVGRIQSLIARNTGYEFSIIHHSIALKHRSYLCIGYSYTHLPIKPVEPAENMCYN